MRPRDKRAETDAVRTEIKVWMARRRLNASELAARLGHDPSWVSKRVGAGATVALTVDDLTSMADALDVPIVEFFRVADTTPGQSIYYRKSA